MKNLGIDKYIQTTFFSADIKIWLGKGDGITDELQFQVVPQSSYQTRLLIVHKILIDICPWNSKLYAKITRQKTQQRNPSIQEDVRYPQS